MQLLFFLLAAIFASAAMALYGPKSDVILVNNDKNFKDEVLKFNGVVIVEFFAPWYVNLY
jgi:hypothetical protein